MDVGERNQEGNVNVLNGSGRQLVVARVERSGDRLCCALDVVKVVKPARQVDFVGGALTSTR